MAYPIQQSLEAFHTKFGHPVRTTPQLLSKQEARQAFGFIEEEVNELWEALGLDTGCGIDGCCEDLEGSEPNLIESADAIGDIIVTAVGLAVRMGIDTDRVLDAIMTSNMTKEANGMGKIRKGADYVPPKIAEALSI